MATDRAYQQEVRKKAGQIDLLCAPRQHGFHNCCESGSVAASTNKAALFKRVKNRLEICRTIGSHLLSNVHSSQARSPSFRFLNDIGGLDIREGRTVLVRLARTVNDMDLILLPRVINFAQQLLEGF